MSKIIKFLCILLIANLFVKNLEAAVTVRDVVNGFDEDSSRYERLYQIAEALATKLFYLVRAGIMARSFQSDRGYDDENILQFSQQELDDFTFQPDTKEDSNDSTTKPSTDATKKSEKKDEKPANLPETTPKSSDNDEKLSVSEGATEKTADEVAPSEVKEESVVAATQPEENTTTPAE